MVYSRAWSCASTAGHLGCGRHAMHTYDRALGGGRCQQRAIMIPRQNHLQACGNNLPVTASLHMRVNMDRD